MARSVEVKFVGNASSLTRAFGQASSSADSFGKRHPHLVSGMKLVGGAALGLAGVVAGGLTVALKQGVSSLKEHELADAQTAAAIKSTGGAAQVSAGQIRQHAGALEELTGIDDVAIQKGQNLLLTFTNIKDEAGAGNDIFTQTTDIMLDMATAMGTDTSSAAMMLGKALNDPVTGMGKLARAGVTFTEAQKEAIKKMVESGDVMGAQKLILEELRKEFGGSAEAAGKTFAGSINKLKNKFEEFGEKLASKVMPHARKFIDFLTDLLSSGSAGEALGKIGGAIGDLARKFADFVSQVDWGKVSSTIGTKLSAAIRAVNWGAVFSTIGEVFLGLASSLAIGLFEPIYRAIDGFLADASDSLAGFISAFGDMMAFLGQMPGTLGAPFRDAAAGIQEAEDGMHSYADSLRSKWETIDETRRREERLNQALGEVTPAAQDATEAWKRMNDRFKATGLAGLAQQLVGISGKLTLSEAAVLAFAEAFGRVPTRTEVKAILEDKDARRALQGWIDDINNSPKSAKAKAEVIGAGIAKGLLDKVTEAAKKANAQKPKVNTSAPGAKDSKDKLDAVTSSAKTADKQSPNVTVTQSGSSAVTQALRNVQSAASAIERFIRVTISWGGSTSPPGAAGGVTNWRGGTLLVGEEGPELVTLPRGANVHTNAETRRMISGRAGGITVNLYVAGSIHSDRDLTEIIRNELAGIARRNLTTGLA